MIQNYVYRSLVEISIFKYVLYDSILKGNSSLMILVIKNIF